MFYIVTWLLAGIVAIILPCMITWFEDDGIDITVEGLGFSFLALLFGYVGLVVIIAFCISHIFEKHGHNVLYRIYKKDE